jgi:hypothetical protein
MRGPPKEGCFPTSRNLTADSLNRAKRIPEVGRGRGAAYEKVGKKVPRWDEPARKALDLAARMYSLQYEPMIPPTEVHAAANQAVEAGCRDPLILYVYARTSLAPDFPGPAEYSKRLQAASVAMAASDYSPFRRELAIRTALENKMSDPTKFTSTNRRGLAQELDVVFDLLRRSAAEDQRTADWDERWFDETVRRSGCTGYSPAIPRPPSIASTRGSPGSRGSRP